MSATCLELMMFSPRMNTNKAIDVEDNNKSRIELLRPKLLLIANKKMKIYKSANIAVNRIKSNLFTHNCIC
jgi:hypothetical protein